MLERMIAKVLFPVDFSPACHAMAPYVKRAADLFGARVTLVYVCDLASHNGFELIVRCPQEIAAEHLTISKEELRSFLHAEFAEGERALRCGEAAQEIAEAARTGGFDLIVMPTHAGRFRRMLLGSTTAKVLNNAECPVLTTLHAETGVPRPLEHRMWVCAPGLSPDAKRVLQFAGPAARAAGGKLFVVHADCEGRGQDAQRRLKALLPAAEVDAEVHIVSGPVKEVLLDAVRRFDADALVVGRLPRSGALGRLRDFTYSLIRDSPVPVLSV
jgi:nucleotide-binding universal stress UspA family protein